MADHVTYVMMVTYLTGGAPIVPCSRHGDTPCSAVDVLVRGIHLDHDPGQRGGSVSDTALKTYLPPVVTSPQGVWSLIQGEISDRPGSQGGSRANADPHRGHQDWAGLCQTPLSHLGQPSRGTENNPWFRQDPWGMPEPMACYTKCFPSLSHKYITLSWHKTTSKAMFIKNSIPG